MNFVVGVIHSVINVNGAAEFLCRVLDFEKKFTSLNVIVVENGAIAIRLIAAIPDQWPVNTITVELQTQDISAALKQMLTHNEISLLQRATNFSNQDRIETLLQTSYGINILLVQEFNEDQLDIIPPLPASLIWDEKAEACIKKMLKLVPISFRQSARINVTERAEMLAGSEASIIVTLDKALQALAETIPLFQRPVVMCALQQEGIEPGYYFKEPNTTFV